MLGCSILFKPNTALIAATLAFSWLANGQTRKLAHASAGMLLALSTGLFIWLSRSHERVIDFEREKLEDSLMVGLGCVLYLLCTRLVWTHYLILALPLTLTLLRPDRFAERSLLFPLLGGLAVLLLAIAPAAIMSQSDEPHRLAALASCGLVLIFALGLAELWSVRRAVPTA